MTRALPVLVLTPPGNLLLVSAAVSAALGCSIDPRTLHATVTDASDSGDAFDPGDLSDLADGGPVACKGAPPGTPIVVGDRDSPAGDGTISGFVYAAPGLALPTLDFVTPPAGGPLSFQINFDPGVPSDLYQAWAGVGFVFQSPRCVDASAFGGIRFTLAGDLGRCAVNFRLDPSNDIAVAPGGLGACAASYCQEPTTRRLVIGTTVLRFADFSNGIPFLGLDTAALVGLAWGIAVPSDSQIAPCKASFTISDVSFID